MNTYSSSPGIAHRPTNNYPIYVRNKHPILTFRSTLRSPGANQSSRDVSTSNPASLRLLAPPAPCSPTQVMVHANNDEMLTVSCWKTWIERQLWPVVRGLRESRVFKEIFLVVGNEPLAPWHVERFGGRLFPCLKEVGWLVRSLVGWFRRLVVLVLVDR